MAGYTNRFVYPDISPDFSEVVECHPRIRLDIVLIAGVIGQRESVFTVRFFGVPQDLE